MDIGAKIEQIREAKGIKQISIAQELGMSQAAYRKLEKGEDKIRIDQLLKITQFLEIPIEEFLKEEGNNIQIQNNPNNDSENIVQVNHNDVINQGNTFDKERNVWEKLVENNQTEISFLKDEIAFLKELLKKFQG